MLRGSILLPRRIGTLKLSVLMLQENDQSKPPKVRAQPSPAMPKSIARQSGKARALREHCESICKRA